MASRSQAVTAAPTALAGTVEGTKYAVQNLSATPISLAVAAAAPAAEFRTFAIPPYGFQYPTPGAGEHIYVWVPGGDPQGAAAAYEESSRSRGA